MLGESVSKGFESSIQISPIETNSFTWSINANVSYNTSEVLKLGLSDKDTVITVGSVYQIVGRPLGQLYYYMQKTDANGNLIFDKNSGYASTKQQPCKRRNQCFQHGLVVLPILLMSKV